MKNIHKTVILTLMFVLLFCGCNAELAQDTSANDGGIAFTDTVKSESDDVSGNGSDSGESAYTDAEYDYLLVSLADGLNIRTGPGTQYKSVGSINKGDAIALVGGPSDGWYETVYRQSRCYVSSAFTDVLRFEKASERVEAVIETGETLLGYPYVWGSRRYHFGNGVLNDKFVQGEYDCSALTQYVYYVGAGINLNMTTRTQVSQGEYVASENLRRGDLMFFTNSSRQNYSGTERIGHVAIYLGNNYILHTASDYAVIEQISSLRWSYYMTAKRMI